MTTLRPFLPDDAELLAILMQASIEELASDEYTADQRDAWAAAAEAPDFARKLGSSLTLVALDEDGEPVGFAVLAQNRAVTHVHVHPDLIGNGIGRMLLEALAKLAAARGAEGLVADATDNARASSPPSATRKRRGTPCSMARNGWGPRRWNSFFPRRRMRRCNDGS